jgi:hypothetical protein
MKVMVRRPGTSVKQNDGRPAPLDFAVQAAASDIDTPALQLPFVTESRHIRDLSRQLLFDMHNPIQHRLAPDLLSVRRERRAQSARYYQEACGNPHPIPLHVLRAH